MIRIYPILVRERFRRFIKSIKQRPLISISLLISIIVIIKDLFTEAYDVSVILNNQIVVLFVMIYLVAKIINPTQGMTIDYQLLQLKLISFSGYKFLIGLKLVGASLLFLIFCIHSYTEMVIIVCALNATTNIWIFLRNRWNRRSYDLFVAIIVIVGIRYQILSVSLLSMIGAVIVFCAIRKVNYESILSLYKVVYQIGQQRFLGISYSENESRDIQVNAEKLVGTAKERNSDWCEKLYDKDRSFMFYKEFMRLRANLEKYIAYFIISLLVGMCKFYLPKEYIIIIFAILGVIAINFDIQMNQQEAKILLRGYIKHYSVWDIIKNKILIYAMANSILMCPVVFWGWKFLGLSVIFAFLVAWIILYKCFAHK